MSSSADEILPRIRNCPVLTSSEAHDPVARYTADSVASHSNTMEAVEKRFVPMCVESTFPQVPKYEVR